MQRGRRARRGEPGVGAHSPNVGAVRARHLTQLILGLAILATAIGTYAGFTMKFDSTLRHGTRVDGTVTRIIQPAGWDPFDTGRIAVSYRLKGAQRHAEIWLDTDLSDHSVGEELPLWVRGAHVRTRDDVNGPAPLLLMLVVGGLLGLCLTIYGAVRISARAPAPVDVGASRVPLRAFRLNPRKAHMDVLPGQINLFLPAYFGRRLVELPTVGAAFAIDDKHTQSDDDVGLLTDDEDVFFEKPIVVPYFPTASVVRGPNAMIMLPRPARMPSLRRAMMFNQNVSLPFGYRQSRSDEGVWLDGVELAVADPTAARSALLQAGLVEEKFPTKYFAAHRELEHDPGEIASIQGDVASARRFGRVNGILSVLGFAFLVPARITHDFRLAIPGFAALGIQFLLPLVHRLTRRHRATPVAGSESPKSAAEPLRR